MVGLAVKLIFVAVLAERLPFCCPSCGVDAQWPIDVWSMGLCYVGLKEESFYIMLC